MLAGMTTSYGANTSDQGRIGEYRPPSVLPKTSIPEILDSIAQVLLMVAGSVAALVFIIGGIQYALAAGEEYKKTQAKRTLKWGAFGLVIALLSYGITMAVSRIIA